MFGFLVPVRDFDARYLMKELRPERVLLVIRIKHETPRKSWIIIKFACGLLDNFEKCTKNENYQISKFTVLTIFSSQKHKIYHKPLKFQSLYSTSLIIYKTEVTAIMIFTWP